MRRNSFVCVRFFVVVISIGFWSSGVALAGIDSKIEEAIQVLEKFNRSHAIMWYLEHYGEGSKEVLDKQIKEFEGVSSEFEKTLLSGGRGSMRGLSKAVGELILAEMKMYLAELEMSALGECDRRIFAKGDEVIGICNRIQLLEDLKKLAGWGGYRSLRGDIVDKVSRLEKEKKELENQVVLIEKVIKKLKVEIANKREACNSLAVKIGKLGSKLGISAEESVEVQKKINRLEEERFKLLADIHRMEKGPYVLRRAITVGSGRDKRVLKVVGGIEHLEQEKEVLLTKISNLKRRIKEQRQIEGSLDMQIKVQGAEGSRYTKQISELIGQLGSEIGELMKESKTRAVLVEKIKKRIIEADRYASAAKKDLEGFVREVSSKPVPADKVNYLIEESKKWSYFRFTICSKIIDTKLLMIRLYRVNEKCCRFLEEVSGYVRKWKSLPEEMIEMMNKCKLWEVDVNKIVEEIQKLGSEMAKSAYRDVKDSAEVKRAVVMYQLGELIPGRRDEFYRSARRILGEIGNGEVMDKRIAEVIKELKAYMR